jgi:hypothetical protein
VRRAQNVVGIVVYREGRGKLLQDGSSYADRVIIRSMSLCCCVSSVGGEYFVSIQLYSRLCCRRGVSVHITELGATQHTQKKMGAVASAQATEHNGAAAASTPADELAFWSARKVPVNGDIQFFPIDAQPTIDEHDRVCTDQIRPPPFGKCGNPCGTAVGCYNSE